MASDPKQKQLNYFSHTVKVSTYLTWKFLINKFEMIIYFVGVIISGERMRIEHDWSKSTNSTLVVYSSGFESRLRGGIGLFVNEVVVLKIPT